jgi:hypothetical protein
MSATNDDMKETIKTAGLNEENAEKAMLMFEHMVIERLLGPSADVQLQRGFGYPHSRAARHSSYFNQRK